ncbi:RNA polymerase III core binding protein [Aureococcus anophagefferens]|nr:RNA polymerase III core binding protein [Aureococcus anophagefferens]
MKLLENNRLSALTAFLTERSLGDRVIDGRVEAFSCKRAGDDKKLSKQLEKQYADELTSSPGSLDTTSPLGFCREASADFVARSCTRYLSEISDQGFDLLQELWAAVEEAVSLKDCEVFSYVPDLDSDPFSEGALWSFNYFFFNKTLKRIVYFSCVARSKYSADPKSFEACATTTGYARATTTAPGRRLGHGHG